MPPTERQPDLPATLIRARTRDLGRNSFDGRDGGCADPACRGKRHDSGGQANSHAQAERTVNAAQMLVECLENEGVEYIFGIPSGESIAIVGGALNDFPENIAAANVDEQPIPVQTANTPDSYSLRPRRSRPTLN